MRVNERLIVKNDLYYSKIHINQKRDDLKNIHKTFKRFMFKKGESIILKKSGEIMINTSIKSETPFLSVGTRFNSLIIPRITNTNYINIYAEYNKINPNYIVESSKITFSEYKKKQKEAAILAYKEKLISTKQYIVNLKRLNALDVSYKHST